MKHHFTHEEVLNAVRHATGVQIHDLWNNGVGSRHADIQAARAVAAAMCRYHTLMSFPQIAQQVLGRDNHSGTIWSFQRFEKFKDRQRTGPSGEVMLTMSELYENAVKYALRCRVNGGKIPP